MLSSLMASQRFLSGQEEGGAGGNVFGAVDVAVRVVMFHIRIFRIVKEGQSW